jgi:hypothetical protein
MKIKRNDYETNRACWRARACTFAVAQKAVGGGAGDGPAALARELELPLGSFGQWTRSLRHGQTPTLDVN